ncbi:MAG TPA: hypothetical protein DEQ20_02390 [Desulfobulbaceae bacterium]|nr:hypothetical protein [Desulfobulbaceae bacterium]
MPSFSSPLLEDMVINGELNAMDLSRLINIMATDLSKKLSRDFFMVFDDLHLLEHCEQSLNLLGFLLDFSPPQLRFILLSRRPVVLQTQQFRYGKGILQLYNRDLALTVDEADTLMTDILDLNFQKDVIGEINRISDGWVMGVLMATKTLFLHKQQLHNLEDVRKCFKNRNILDFFRQEIFAQIPLAYRHSLMKLSLLEEVHLDLAMKITGDNDIGAKLSILVDGNYFAMTCDKDDQICGFHQLFRDFLQEKANEELTPQEKKQIYQIAIEYSFAKKRMAEALRYCLSAENYEAMEQILMTEGLSFLSMNRGATLLSVLLAVPSEVQLNHGWIALLTGIAFCEISPENCYDYLEQARKIFVDRQEEMGELLSLSQLVFFYWVVAGALKTGAQLLPRTEELYHRHKTYLPLFAKVVVAKNIAAGYCYFHGDMLTAHRYSSLARELAKTLKSKGLEASVILVQSYENMLMGHRNLNQLELEKAYELLLDPHVASVYKMALCTTHIDDLQLHGNFANYFIQKEQLLALIPQEKLSQTIVGPFLYLWDIGIIISQGKFKEALAKVDEGRRSGPVAETPHILSQFLHWKAYILAHLDEPEAALKAAQKSLLLREFAGGPFHEILNRILLGTVFARLGMHDKAEEVLSQALSEAIKYRMLYLKAGCLLHRANAYSLVGKIEEAVRDLGEGLGCMRDNGYYYVLGLTPEKLENILRIAVQHDIEIEYVRGIAQERLKSTFVKGGRVVPLLFVRMLGEFQLEIEGQVILTADEVTPLQCRLLKLLATSHNMKMGQEVIQLAFWPESSPEKARSNFDTLLSRLRKSLQSVMGQLLIKDYLILHQGILCLQNCVLDAHLFQQMTQKGFEHVKRNEWWQAANCFHPAVDLWHSDISAEAIEDDQVYDFIGGLKHQMIKLVSTWGKHLASASREEQALVILQKGLKLDPTEASLVRLIYHLHRGRGELVKAKTMLKEYEEKLKAEDFASSELQMMISEVVA